MVKSIDDAIQKKYRTLFWACLGSLTIFRLLLVGQFGLGVDESHYLMYARHPAWGYLDHPPMVAFLAAFTGLLGDGLFFVRLGPIIASTLCFVLLRYLALALYRDERIAFWSLIAINLMPYQHLLLVALLPDATLNVFWCGTLLAFWYGLHRQGWLPWGLAGLCFGGALLSKYHAALLPLCLLGYLLTSSQKRSWLLRWQPWLAIAIGLAVFAPNVIWNARRDWVSYVFQLQHGGGGEFEFEKIFQVLGGQLGVWSPLIFILLIVISISLIRKNPKEEADRFVLWTSLPVFIFFCGNGLFGDFLPHWPAAGWWTGTIAVAAALIHKTNPREKNARRWQRWTASAGVIGLVLSITLYAGLLFPVVAPLYTHAQKLSEKLHQSFAFIQPLEPFKPKYDVTNDLFGWNDIAAKVEKIKASMPNPDQTFVFSHRFFTASQVSVFLDPQTVSTTLRNKMDQYHLWFDPEKYLGWDALFVDEGRYGDRPLRYRPLFEKVNPQGIKFEVYRQGYLAHRMTIYKYFGFKGQFEK